MAKKINVGKNAAVLTISKFTVTLIGLVTSMLLARFRTLEEYGTYSQIIMVTDLVSTFLLLGLPNSINYFLSRAENDEERQRFFSVYFTLSNILTIVISACLFLSLPLIINYFKNPLITSFAYVLAIYPWATLMLNNLGNTCIVYGNTKKLLVFNIVHSVANLLLLLMAKFLRISFQNYMRLYMASMIVFAVVGITWMYKLLGKIKIFLNKKIIKEIFVFSIPLGLSAVVGTINVELDKLVISRFFTTEEYAIFANAAKELPVTIVATSITAVLLPTLVRFIKKEENEAAVKLWGNAANISFCFMILIAGGFFVFAPDILSLFYSAKYVTAGGVAVFRIYSLILIFRAIYWGIMLNALGKTKFIFYSSLITMALNLILNIVFYKLFGFIGPAISTLMATFIMSIVQLLWTCKLIKVKFTNIMPWKNIFIFIIQTIIIAAAAFFVKYKLLSSFKGGASIIVSIGMGVVWTVIYLLINKNIIIKNWKALNAD